MKETILVNCPDGSLIVRIQDIDPNKEVRQYGKVDGIRVKNSPQG